MNIGVLVVTLHLNGCMSLKDKRSVLNTLKEKLRKRFNVSVAEVDEMDKWQKAVIALASVSNSKKHLSSGMDKTADFIGGQRRLTVLDRYTEII